MKQYFDVLRRCPLFWQIEDENLLSMLGCLGAKLAHFDKKETILAEGDEARYVGILLAGSAQIIHIDYYGNRSLVFGVEPAQLFCESFACAGVDSIPVDVVATEKSDILFIDCERITRACSHACSFHQQMIYNLMKIVATENLLFHQKIEITTKRSTRDKLMTYLLSEAKKSHSSRFTIPYDRQELADYLAVDRSGLSVEIGKLIREGVIRSRRQEFELLETEL